MKILYEIFDPCYRLGPGDDKFTIKAYKLLQNLPENPEILDMGCGKGAQSFVLAANFNCNITAVDNYQPYIDFINKKAMAEKIDNKLKAVNQSMMELDYPRESFDIIWSEGAIFVIGFENGLTKIKSLLKPGGYAVITEACWFKKNRPEDLQEFWDFEYPAIKMCNENIKQIKNLGFKLIDHFPLPDSAWSENYYKPYQKSLDSLKIKYRDDNNAMESINLGQLEIDMFSKYHEYYGYEFFIVKK